jgi:hypothetical protein
MALRLAPAITVRVLNSLTAAKSVMRVSLGRPSCCLEVGAGGAEGHGSWGFPYQDRWVNTLSVPAVGAWRVSLSTVPKWSHKAHEAAHKAFPTGLEGRGMA